jgi:hypothetical protein
MWRMPQSAARVASATTRLGATPVLRRWVESADGCPKKTGELRNEPNVFRRRYTLMWLTDSGLGAWSVILSLGFVPPPVGFASVLFGAPSDFLGLRFGEILCKSVQSAGGRFWRGYLL